MPVPPTIETHTIAKPTIAKPTLAKRRSRVGLYVFLPPALLAGSLIANGAIQASQRGNATVVAGRALTAAIAKLPFSVRLPEALPAGARMVRVVLDEPDSDQGFQAYQLNIWYRTPGEAARGGGRTIHVWQSNDKFLARRLRDPLQVVGKPVIIDTAQWHQVIDDRVAQHVVTTLSRRFDDGITMTVDAADPALAIKTVERLVLND